VKITLSDKKVLGAFLKRSSFEWRVLTIDGDELRGTWGDRPLIAKWDKKDKLIQIPSADKGVRKAQTALSTLLG
jgi:hypothetical protein